jgi:hypothetical protein
MLSVGVDSGVSLELAGRVGLGRSDSLTGCVQCFCCDACRARRCFTWDGTEMPASVKLTNCLWLQRRHRTGYRIRKICFRSAVRSLLRRNACPGQNWHWIVTPAAMRDDVTVGRS